MVFYYIVLRFGILDHKNEPSYTKIQYNSMQDNTI